MLYLGIVILLILRYINSFSMKPDRTSKHSSCARQSQLRSRAMLDFSSPGQCERRARNALRSKSGRRASQRA